MTAITDELRAAIHAQLTSAPKQRKNEAVKHYRYNNGRAYHSDALGVNPEQIDEARNELRRHGIMAEFDSEGRCIVESEKQYHDIARATGMKDGRDGYAVKDNDGKQMLSGRQQVERRREMFQQLRRDMRG